MVLFLCLLGGTDPSELFIVMHNVIVWLFQNSFLLKQGQPCLQYELIIDVVFPSKCRSLIENFLIETE